MEKNIISKRYLNDGVSLINLDEIQKKYLIRFLKDGRIKYKTISECPLCGDADFILIAEKESYGIPLETVVCKSCGLVRSYKQLNERSSIIFYSEYYRNIYEPAMDEIVEERYPIAEKRLIPKYLTNNKIVLEIGCGGGWNLMPFLRAGYKHYGFDFDEEFIERGKTKGLNLYLGGAEEAVKMNIKCDYLILSEVLEHVDDPINFLIGLKPLLNEGAIINIHVPSLDLLFWGYSNCDLLGTLQNAHNFLFNEFTLKAVATIAGFKIINCIGPRLVLQNSQKAIKPALNPSTFNRGKKIVSYLKFVEKSLCFRKKMGIKKISFKKMYAILKPIECCKMFCLNYFGEFLI